jgi:hypothetical protein
MAAMDVTRVVAVVLGLLLAGCGNKRGGPAAGASATSTSARPAPPALPRSPSHPVPQLRDAAGKLTKAGFDGVWNDVFMGSASAYEPAEKKLATFEARVGKPARVEKDQRIWWVHDGASCYRMDLGKDGTKGTEQVTLERCER